MIGEGVWRWADYPLSPPVTLLLAPSPPESHTISRHPLKTMLPRKNIPTGLLLFYLRKEKSYKDYQVLLPVTQPSIPDVGDDTHFPVCSTNLVYMCTFMQLYFIVGDWA